MAAQFTVGQQLANGATVVTDDFQTLSDGTTVEHMVDSAGNVTTTTTPGPGTPSDVQATLTQRAIAALVNNATYLAIASPNNTQNTAQAQALTRQVNGIIRLLLNRLDTTAGT